MQHLHKKHDSEQRDPCAAHTNTLLCSSQCSSLSSLGNALSRNCTSVMRYFYAANGYLDSCAYVYVPPTVHLLYICRWTVMLCTLRRLTDMSLSNDVLDGSKLCTVTGYLVGSAPEGAGSYFLRQHEKQV